MIIGLHNNTTSRIWTTGKESYELYMGSDGSTFISRVEGIEIANKIIEKKGW